MRRFAIRCLFAALIVSLSTQAAAAQRSGRGAPPDSGARRDTTARRDSTAGAPTGDSATARGPSAVIAAIMRPRLIGPAVTGGRIVSIAENVVPLSERVIPSGSPVRAVLER